MTEQALTVLLPAGYKLLAIDKNGYVLAQAVNPRVTEPYVTWLIGNDGSVYNGTYFNNAANASMHYAWLCFDWFKTENHLHLAPYPQFESFGRHSVTTYIGWLIVYDVKIQRYALYSPTDNEIYGCYLGDLDQIQNTLVCHQTADDLDEALDYIDNRIHESGW